MFESDDFDQVLSQIDFTDLSSTKSTVTHISESGSVSNSTKLINLPTHDETSNNQNTHYERQNVNTEKKFNFKIPQQKPQSDKSITSLSVEDSSGFDKSLSVSETAQISPKHTKRKMINSFFDTSNKRKFPGPAGILSGTLEQDHDNNICQMELLSQDIDFSQNNLRTELFETPLWKRLNEEVSTWGLGVVNSIKSIKQQALAGNLRRRKAQVVAAFVEAIDRSATDPLIILRDDTGSIKCTLHRDAWCSFSSYIASEYCAFVLSKPTVLTTGGAFKKHYLNITLSNIFAIYSSAVINDENEKPFPDGYNKIYEDDFTVIKGDVSHSDIDLATTTTNGIPVASNDDLLADIDSSLFLDEIF